MFKAMGFKFYDDNLYDMLFIKLYQLLENSRDIILDAKEKLSLETSLTFVSKLLAHNYSLVCLPQADQVNIALICGIHFHLKYLKAINRIIHTKEQ